MLRPTWHFVSPADIGWVLAATSPRVHQRNGTQYRSLGLDPRTLDRGAASLESALADGPRTRAELGHALGESGTRLAHLVMHAELEGLICSGPLRGSQHTYARLAERAPADRARHPEQPLAELLRRFVVGHGPTSLADFTRWSSAAMGEARAALDVVAGGLESVEVEGETLWFDPAGPPPAEAERALLLPLYDELLLSHPQLGFGVADRHPHRPGADLFVGSVVLDRVNVGLWRRTVRGRHVDVATDLAPGLSSTDRKRVAEAVEDLRGFLTGERETPG